MGQPGWAGWAAICLLLTAAPAGCDDAARPPRPIGKSPRVASVTPAGTDLVIAIGAGDHLVGISTYDGARAGAGDKPRVGNYRDIDWERLAPLDAQLLLTQHADDRLPPGLGERCQEMHIQVLNLQLNTLSDITREMLILADRLGEHDGGIASVARLEHQLAEVRARVANLPTVRTVLVTDDSGMAVAGADTFLDDLLKIAGGVNAASSLGKPYAMVDRETLRQMAPAAVIQLIPDGDRKPQVVEHALEFWHGLGDLPATKTNRIYIVTEWYALEPGGRVGSLAEKFGLLLHPPVRP